MDHAASKSCLAKLSDIMDLKDNQGQIVFLIFYHVDPSDIKYNNGRKHSPEPETEHIEDIVEYVIHKLTKQQVFLSFRGEDTCLNFTAHLKLWRTR
ncbi:hypothetical protein GQ457_12G032650 [Hibiscus cannabinus]